MKEFEPPKETAKHVFTSAFFSHQRPSSKRGQPSLSLSFQPSHQSPATLPPLRQWLSHALFGATRGPVS